MVSWRLLEPCLIDKNFQVVPIGENHCIQGTECWCEPRIEFENGERIVIHEARDGRK